MRLVRQQLRSDTGWVYRRTQAFIYLSDGVTLASLFTGDAVPYSNPITTGEDGMAEFYVEDNVLALTYRAVQGFLVIPVRPLPVGVVVTQTDTGNFTLPGVAADTIFLSSAVGTNSLGQFILVSASDPSDSGACVGISEMSALPGQSMRVITSGFFDKSSLTLVRGAAVYVGVSGVLTQDVPTFPASKFSQRVGTAVSSTKILVDIEPAIDLA